MAKQSLSRAAKAQAHGRPGKPALARPPQVTVPSPLWIADVAEPDVTEPDVVPETEPAAVPPVAARMKRTRYVRPAKEATPDVAAPLPTRSTTAGGKLMSRGVIPSARPGAAPKPGRGPESYAPRRVSDTPAL